MDLYVIMYENDTFVTGSKYSGRSHIRAYDSEDSAKRAMRLIGGMGMKMKIVKFTS